MIDYTTNDFRTMEHVYEARKKIIEIMSSSDIVDEEQKRAKVSFYLMNCADTHEKFNFLMFTIYVLDRDFADRMLKHVISMFSRSTTDVDKMIASGYEYIDISKYLETPTLKTEYSKDCPNTIINDLHYAHKMLLDSDVDQLLINWLIENKKIDTKRFQCAVSKVQAKTLIFTLKRLKELKVISWWAFISGVGNCDYSGYVGIESNVYKVLLYTEEGNYKPKCIVYLIGNVFSTRFEYKYDIVTHDNDKYKINTSVMTISPWEVYNKPSIELESTFGALFDKKNPLMGFNVDKHNNLNFCGTCTDGKNSSDVIKFFSDTIKKSFDDENYEDAKDNLACLLHKIAMLDTDIKHGEEKPNSSYGVYLNDNKQFRSMLIGDFKFYLNKMEKKFPNFDMLDTMKNYHKNMYFNAEMPKDTESYYSNLLVTIRYW
jgi:hypothetical protein